MSPADLVSSCWSSGFISEMILNILLLSNFNTNRYNFRVLENCQINIFPDVTRSFFKQTGNDTIQCWCDKCSCCLCSITIWSITGKLHVSNQWSIEQKTLWWLLIDNKEAGLSDHWTIMSQADPGGHWLSLLMEHSF